MKWRWPHWFGHKKRRLIAQHAELTALFEENRRREERIQKKLQILKATLDSEDYWFCECRSTTPNNPKECVDGPGTTHFPLSDAAPADSRL